MAEDYTGLDADQANYFRTRRRQVNDTYNLGLAQNLNSRQRLRREYGRQRTDLRRQFGDMRMKLPGAFAQGGLLNSGLWQRQLQRYGTERSRALGNLAGQFQDERGSLLLAKRQLGQVRRNAIYDVDQALAARRATAATLRAAAGVPQF